MSIRLCFQCDKSCADKGVDPCECGHPLKSHAAPRAAPSQSGGAGRGGAAAAPLPFKAVTLKSTGGPGAGAGAPAKPAAATPAPAAAPPVPPRKASGAAAAPSSAAAPAAAASKPAAAAASSTPAVVSYVYCSAAGCSAAKCAASDAYKCVCGHYKSAHSTQPPSAKPALSTAPSSSPSSSSAAAPAAAPSQPAKKPDPVKEAVKETVKETPRDKGSNDGKFEKPALKHVSSVNHSTSAPPFSASLSQLTSQFGPLLASGLLKKKSHSNRHNWHSRCVGLFEKALLYFDPKTTGPGIEEQTMTTMRGMLPSATMLKIELAKEGKGSGDKVRFNLTLDDSRIYEFIAEKSKRDAAPALAAQWVQILDKHCAKQQLARSSVSNGTAPPPLTRIDTQSRLGQSSSSSDPFVPRMTAAQLADATPKQVLFEGAMSKKATVSRHLWQSRYFTLTPLSLSYWHSEAERRKPGSEPQKVIATSSIKRVEQPSSGKGSEAGCRLNLELTTSSRVFELMADSKSSAQEWVSLLSLIVSARSGAFESERIKAELARVAEIDRVRRAGLLEKEKLERDMKANMEKEVARLKAEHAAKLSAADAAAQKASADKEREIKLALEQTQREQDAKIKELEQQRAALEEAQRKGEATAAGAASLAAIQSDLAREKQEAQLRAAMEAEREKLAQLDAERRKLAEMREGLSREAEAQKAQAKQAYQNEAMQIKAKHLAEMEAEKQLRDREKEENERKIVEKYERELESTRAAAAAASKSASSKGDAAAIEAERQARLKLEAELVALQAAQEEREAAESAKARAKIEAEQASLKAGFQKEFAAAQAAAEAKLAQEQALRVKKEAEMAAQLDRERVELRAEVARLEADKKRAEAEAKREAERAAEATRAAARASESASSAKELAEASAAAQKQQAESDAKNAEQLKRATEALEAKAADLRIAEQLNALRATSAAQAAELEAKQARADQEYKASLKEMNDRLESERRQLRALQAALDQKASDAAKPRVLSILREGEAHCLGMVELAFPHADKTLADLRALLQDEIDELPDEFAFLCPIEEGSSTKAPVSRKQEGKKLVSALPSHEAVIIRVTAATAVSSMPAAAAATSSSSVPDAPSFSSAPAAPPMAPAAPAFSASPSVASTAPSRPNQADLLSSIREGRTLKKAAPLPKAADSAKPSGLTGLLSAALAGRRTNLNDDEDHGRKRADSWDLE